jgi:hypothetical protein
MSTMSRNAGTLLLGLYRSHSQLKRSSGTLTRAWGAKRGIAGGAGCGRGASGPAASLLLRERRAPPLAAASSLPPRRARTHAVGVDCGARAVAQRGGGRGWGVSRCKRDR